MRKLIVIFAFILSTELYANMDYKIPDSYEVGVKVEGDIQELVNEDKQKKVIYYLSGSSNTNEDPWITSCAKTMVDGIPSARCTLLKKNLLIRISENKTYPYYIFFDKPVIEAMQKKGKADIGLVQLNTKYKIDSSSTISLPETIIPNGYNSNAFVRDLKPSKTLYYSIQKSNGYKSYSLDLVGFNQALIFAQAFINLNR